MGSFNLSMIHFCIHDEINRVEVGEAALLEDSIPEGHAPTNEYLEEQRMEEGI